MRAARDRMTLPGVLEVVKPFQLGGRVLPAGRRFVWANRLTERRVRLLVQQRWLRIPKAD